MSNSLPPVPLPTSILKQIVNKKTLIDECLWALEYPELQMACFLARICANKPPVKCEFNNIGSILQVGPTCGLTALSMLLGGVPTAEQLLQDAQQKHFTNNGEMFSAHSLYELICDNIPMINNNNNHNNNNEISQPNTFNANGTDTEMLQKNKKTQHNIVIECQMHEGLLNCAKVKESLQQGACIFVPYPF